MDRQTDRPALIDQGPLNRLPDPPGRVGGETAFLADLKALDSLDQAHVAFFDQVQKRQTTIHVALGDFNHQPQVRFNHPGPGRLVPLADADRQLPLFLGGQKVAFLYLLQVKLDCIAIMTLGLGLAFRRSLGLFLHIIVFI